MPSLKQRVTARVDAVRERRPLVDHAVRTVRHYGSVRGSNQAGAVTFFGFVSFFPLLALAFAVVGFVADWGPDVRAQLVEAVEGIFPRLVSEEGAPGTIALADVQAAAPGILSIGLPVLLYTGLGWLSALRDALLVVFEEPEHDHPNPVVGKLRDVVTLAAIGSVLLVSVAVAGLARAFSEAILGAVGVPGAGVLLAVVTLAAGLATNMVLFFALFRLLAAPDLPTRSLWAGALLGAVGFELLKQLSTYLLASTKQQPAFQAFGIALILVVWINYFARVVVYAAAWAHTSPEARERRDAARAAREARELAALEREVRREVRAREHDQRLSTGAAAAMGGGAVLAAVALARRTVKRDHRPEAP